MEYIKYEKTFVMLTEQNREFGQRNDLPAKGHIKIETGSGKGALRIGVQNLRFFEKREYIYKLILFGKKKERTLHTVIGTVVVNRYGGGETYFRFDPADVDGRGGKIHDFYYAIVAAVSTRNEKEPLHPVLKGTLELPRENEGGKESGERAQRGNAVSEENGAAAFVKAAGVAPDEQDPEQAAGQKRTAPEAEVPPGNAEAADAKSGAEKAEAAAAKADRTTKPTGSGAEYGAAADAAGAANQAAAGGEASAEPARMQFNDYYNKYLLEWCRRTEAKADFLEGVAPFHYDETEAAWKKIVSVSNFPLVSPAGRYFAAKYRHYLFGLSGERYFFGVPGRFLREEQPEGGESGFVFWQPIAGAEKLRATEADCPDENRKAAYGYWIVAVDRKTGSIEEV